MLPGAGQRPAPLDARSVLHVLTATDVHGYTNTDTDKVYFDIDWKLKFEVGFAP